jgi:putative ABC transport system permease protein
MFKNYVLTAFRAVRRNRVHSLIKIFGLSLGLAACILIYLFVVDELSFDGFHENGNRLFRVMQVRYDKDTERETGLQQFIPPAVGPELEKSLAEIEHQTRITNGMGVIRFGDRIFREPLTLVDAPFFQMFSFPLIKGDERTVFAVGSGVVMTRSAAKKYFGEDARLGSPVTISCGGVQRDFFLTGIAEDPPENSSIRFSCLIDFRHLPFVLNNPDILDNWKRWYCPLFVQLKSESLRERADTGLDQFCSLYFAAINREYVESGYDPFTFGLQPVASMRIDSRVVGAPGPTASYLLSLIAFAILMIACLNFMNLSIGLSSSRSMDVGMRKVLGARRGQLVRQYVIEGVIVSFIAVLLGLLIAEFLLVRFNSLAGKTLSLSTIFSGVHWLVIAAIGLIAGLLAGIWPALVLSAFQPGDIMKGRLKIGGKARLTRVLVVFQFALSIVLALTALFLTRQVSYMMNKNPGYQSDGLVVVMTQENEQTDSERLVELFRNEVGSRERILGIAASNREFGTFLPGSTLELGDRSLYYRFNRVEPGFLATLKIPLVEGRDFGPVSEMDRDAVIVNKTFMERLGPEYRVGDIIGDPSRGFPSGRRIIGVAEDCHFESLRREIDPLLLYVGPGPSPRRNVFSRMFVRVRAEQVRETVDFLAASWKKVQPDKPFIHVFQDDVLKRLYNSDRRWSAIIRYASVFSLLLACLGIFGLTSLSLARREKEIGIRKVLGARLEQILYLSVKEFAALIAAANLIAWPAAYLLMRSVLRGYAYRTPMGAHHFLLTGAASLLLAMLTILYLSLRTALKHPRESLRYE